ncbi:MAG: dTDP-glucose 4,6-dehydratase [Solirubrobacterales bacterium]|jgi:NAD dependent epimerase/dehydratase|nr:dTDP-glucose 4,6-dehydratase [Solirubrobacterales bacterium]
MTGRNALVTGAGGFVGGHLAARLVADGARVRAFVRYNSRGDRGALEWLDPDVLSEIEVVMGDLRDSESVARAVRGSELAFHLGAQVAIPYSYLNARDFFETNVLGALNVAEAALTHAVAHVVHTSSSEVYGTAQSVPIREDHPLGAQSPYAASKVGADKLMETFHRAHGLPVTVLRPFNTFGPHQSARAIVPTIISQALASDTLHLGALTPRRDLTYVSDTVAGFVAAAGSERTVGRTFQLGSGVDVSVGEIVELVGGLLGRSLHVVVDERRLRPPASEVDRLVSDPALALELCGWRARVGLEEGLGRTIDWVRSHPHVYRPAEYAV